MRGAGPGETPKWRGTAPGLFRFPLCDARGSPLLRLAGRERQNRAGTGTPILAELGDDVPVESAKREDANA
jgi:hypothetical protein